MKNIMNETAQDICVMSEGPCTHKETLWLNEQVADAVREEKIKYANWKRENLTEMQKEYKMQKWLFP